MMSDFRIKLFGEEISSLDSGDQGKIDTFVSEYSKERFTILNRRVSIADPTPPVIVFNDLASQIGVDGKEILFDIKSDVRPPYEIIFEMWKSKEKGVAILLVQFKSDRVRGAYSLAYYLVKLNEDWDYEVSS